MSKRTEIFIGIAFVLCGIFFLAANCAGQVYQVPDYTGGINRAYDGTNLKPNQAWDLTNFVFKPNALECRQGYSYVNAAAFYGVSNQEVKGIITYNGNIISVVGSKLFKGTDHIQWTGDSIIVTNGSKNIYDIGDKDWLYMKTGYGDSISLGGVRYGISAVDPTNDSTLLLTINYAGASDTLASYTVRHTVNDFGSFIVDAGILYILSSNNYGGFITAYNDTTYKYLAVVDTGITTSSIDLDTSSYLSAGTRVCIRPGRVRAVNYNHNEWDSCGIAVGDLFTYYYQYNCGHNSGIHDGVFSSVIISFDTTQFKEYVELADAFYTPCSNSSIRPISDLNRWEIRRNATVTPIDSDYVGLADSSKYWYDIEFGDRLYTGFYAVGEDSGYGAIRNIYQNSDTILVIDGFIDTGEAYYIMAAIPNYLLRNNAIIDSLYKEQPRISQMTFYQGQWYGIGSYMTTRIGWEGYPNPFGDPDTLYVPRYNRVWYSHPGFPAYAPSSYNFELGSEDIGTVLFRLRDILFIGTDKSIWATTGTPQVANGVGSQILQTVVSNNGIPDLDNWAKATEEYGYFTNRTGIYRFNGVRPEKISWLVDPLIEDNYNSRIVMVYRNPDLYISFTDSNFTLDYNEAYDSFTKLDFGMTCAYAPPDTDIIYFGLNGQPGRIYYYPNGEYWDRNSPTDSASIDVTYESGWQTLTDGPWMEKKLEKGYFPVKSDTSFHIDIYADFNTTASDTVTTDTYTQKAYRFDGLSATGDYFKTKITATVIDSMILRPYRLIWQEADMKEGD